MMLAWPAPTPFPRHGPQLEIWGVAGAKTKPAPQDEDLATRGVPRERVWYRFNSKVTSL